KEGELWLLAHKKWNLTSAFQGIALEVVRARLKTIDQLRLNSEKTKALRECVVALNTIGKIESDHRQEALLLRRDVVAKMGTGASLSVQELLALGDEAAADRNWTEAAAYYHQAIEAAGKNNETKSVDIARRRLPQVLYRQGADYYAAHNMERALAICGEL